MVLARFAAERPDLVLMDTRMPGLSGLEAAMRLVSAAGGHATERVLEADMIE